jgi:hypothetical protein
MIRRYAAALGFLALGFTAQAQSAGRFGFEYRPVAKVVQGTDTLDHAWAGGLNTPQFSSVDLDGDGRNDLFAFDRESSRVYTFLNVAAATGTGRRWRYAPEFETLFPDDMHGWAVLRDYDCDGRPDLFSHKDGDIRVFRNVAGPGGIASFVLFSGQLRATGASGSYNIAVIDSNLPDFKDVNGDGKLDVITYTFLGSTSIELYLNTSPAPCGSGLTFELSTDHWGQMLSCGTGCAAYSFQGQPCAIVPRQPLHSPGHNILLLDLDNDGDQDLLDGRDDCPELVRLLNQGTTTLATFTQAGATTSFPSAATPAGTAVSPAAYSIDTNFDGRPDLVSTPNMLYNLADQVSLRNTVKLFENTATSGAPVFTARPEGFLQAEMIDLSEGAAPTFGDLSGDGLVDMLVANHADRVGGVYRATLTYYQNVGTRTRPVFSLVTNDYLGLSSQLYQGLKPTLVDLNRDGALDLAFAAWRTSNNRIYYILNTAAANQPVAFNAANITFFRGQGAEGSGILPYAKGDYPCFTDVDNDGYVDLLIGTNETREPGMALRYFRNRGQGLLEDALMLANNDYGQIRGLSFNSRPMNLSPVVADFDFDGQQDLVVVDDSGVLRFYSNFRNQGAAFLERTDVLYNSLSGQYGLSRLGQGSFQLSSHLFLGLAGADVNGDGAPELFVGTQAGGVISYTTRNRVGTASRAEAARALGLSVYPNPATTMATIETATPTRLTLLDLTGRELRHDSALLRQHYLSLNGLAAGIYLVRAEGSNGAVAVQRLQVQ